MAHLLGFTSKKSDDYNLQLSAIKGLTSSSSSSSSPENPRFVVSNVHDNPAFELDEEKREKNQEKRSNGNNLPTEEKEEEEEEEEVSASGLFNLTTEAMNEHPTTYVKTLQRLTREVLPHMDLYRDARSVHRISRPSLDELHNESVTRKDSKRSNNNQTEEMQEKKAEGVKFGWIIGVMIRCLLNIWGPIMFIRLTYIVGRCGIIQALCVILLSDVIVVITGLSISAISTNGLVKGGGTYYLISRSLGPEYGGSIGLIFSFANAMAVAMHTVGFAESLKDMLKTLGLSIVDSDINDMRIIGVVTACVLVSIIVVGMEWEQKAQVFLLFVLLVAIADVIVGSFMPENAAERAKGFAGWNVQVAYENLDSDYRGESFFKMFAVFFPATTGILAGANISGDLKDPSSAIPKGTLLAILLSSFTYVVFIIVAGCTVYRDATGNIDDFLNGTYLNCTESNPCNYGLQNNYQVMELISAFGYLVYAGCFAATLSSALACLVSAPKIFQALAKDKIYPHLEWFGTGYGKNQEPLRSYFLAFLIAVIFIVIADFNVIAPIISNFFMAAYCLINFACFHAALAKSPGFRPGFRYWNMWISLLGALLSMAVMFVMSWETALGTFFICFFLYIYLSYKKPDVNWGSSQQAVTYRSALKAVQELIQVEDHVKNYRSHVLCMTGSPWSRPALVDLAYQITKGIGLMICGHVIKTPISHRERQEMMKKSYSWLNERKVKAFYNVMQDKSLPHGTKALIQGCGVGKLKPNMMLMGFMNNWQNRSTDEILEYFDTIHAAFDLHLAMGILRVEQGLDFTFYTSDNQVVVPSVNNTTKNGKPAPMLREMSSTSILSVASNASSVSMDLNKSSMVSSFPEGNKKKKKEEKRKATVQTAQKEIPKDVQRNIDLFRTVGDSKEKQTIDVWWLYDDGGLTLLVPYILTTRKHWQKANLRVFSLANKNHEIDQQQLNLASLLSKFRICCQDVAVLADVTKKPKDHSLREFELLISKFRNEDEMNGLTISDTEYNSLLEKSYRYVRIRELLLHHSRNAALVVVTMPMPRKNRVPAALYLSWLDTLTRDMPPTILIRGNQTSVLTFYS